MSKPDGGAGPLGILHVVKAGGSAVRDSVAALEGAYTGPRYFDMGQFWSEDVLVGMAPDVADAIVTRDSLDAYRRDVRAHRLIMGHVAASTLVGAGCTAVAVQVREPRSRLLSLYRYWQSQPADTLATLGVWGREVVARAELPIGEFLAAPSVRPAVDSAIARQAVADPFAPGAAPADWRPDAGAVDRFVAICAVADWSSSSDRFVERIWAHLGAHDPQAVGRVNETEVTGGTQSIDRSVREQLAHLTRFDAAFLEQMMSSGTLPLRTDAQLDGEFEETADRLGFTIR